MKSGWGAAGLGRKRWASAFAVVAAAFGAPAGASELSELVAQFVGMQSLKVSAKAQAVSHFGEACGPGLIGVPADGYFDFKAVGDLWRQRCHISPSLYDGMDTEAAFNGQWLQVMDLDSGVLTVSALGDNQSVGMTIFNPLFALVDFLMPVSETNETDPVLLREVRAAAAAADLSGLAWAPAPGSNGMLEQATVGSGMYDGQAYTYVVVALAGQRATPVRIDMVGASGLLSRTSFSNWESVATGDGRTLKWPRTVTYEIMAEEQAGPAWQMTLQLTEIEVNQGGIAPTEFLLDWNAPQHIWLADTQAYLR